MHRRRLIDRTIAGRPRRLAVAVLAVALAACGQGEGEGAGPPAGTPVETAAVEQRDLAVTVSSVGSLEADASAEVASQYSGVVSDILFDEGQDVRRGRVLVRLDSDKLRAELEAAEAAVTRARAEAANLSRQLERNEQLLADGAISRQAFEDVRTAHESAEARLEEAQARASLARRTLEDATIRAPFEGRIGGRDFDVGDYVTEGRPLFSVVDDDTLKVEFAVPEQYVGRLETGLPVRVQVRSEPDRWHQGRVYFVSPTVDRANRTVALKARVPNPGRELSAGQFADVRTVIEVREGALVVPEAAIVPREGENFVFVVRGGTALQRRVALGERQRGIVEVRSGVARGDTVVIAGQQRLADSAAVSVAEMRPAGGPGYDPEDEGPPLPPADSAMPADSAGGGRPATGGG